MKEMMETFTTHYITWLLLVPFFAGLIWLCCKCVSNLVLLNPNDAMIYFLIILFVVITFSPFTTALDNSPFLSSRMKQFDGIEEYEERLERTGEQW